MNSILRRLGIEIKRVPKNGNKSPGIVLYRYLKEDGSFNYEDYKKIQEEGNRRKIDNVWVIEENIAFLSEYIRSIVRTPKFGICHGTRRGKEQEWFRKYLGCEVIGTEISSTASSFPNTIQWDFHEVKPEWINAVDFIYTNSLDHSYDPESCLNAWMDCLRKDRLCIIEHSTFHESQSANELDPFGADLFLMPYLVTKWGKGKYGVRQLIAAPRKSSKVSQLTFIVIQKF